MPVVFNQDRASFEDVCTVEEALALLEFLKDNEAPVIDLSACTYLHTALLQLLMSVCPKVVAGPADVALARWAAPLLAEAQAGT